MKFTIKEVIALENGIEAIGSNSDNQRIVALFKFKYYLYLPQRDYSKLRDLRERVRKEPANDWKLLRNKNKHNKEKSYKVIFHSLNDFNKAVR